MSLTVLAWLAVGAYALHIAEEHILGWHSWARRSMNLSMEWDAYTTIEVVLLILGAMSAMLAASAPVFALAFAAMLVINVTFFHLLPMLISGGRFSPGVITGVFLFYPVAWFAYQSTTVPTSTHVWSILIGAAMILWPVALVKMRSQPYFRPGGEAAAGTRVVRRPVRRRR